MANTRNEAVRQTMRSSTRASKIQIDERGKRASQAHASAEAKFKRKADLFFRKWAEDSFPSARQGAHYRESREDYLVRWTYLRVRLLRKEGREAILPLLLSDAGKRHKGPHDITGKPFKQALLLLSWWCEESLGSRLMTPKRRMNLSDAMEYAYRHDVPAKFVNGFIQKAGIGIIRGKLEAGYAEPGFSRLRVRRESAVAS